MSFICLQTKQRNADYHRIVAMIHENTKKKFLLKPPPNKQTSKLADAVKLPKGTIKKSTRRPKGVINKPKKNTNDANDMIQNVLKNGGDLVQKLYATQTSSSGRLRSPTPLQNMFDACIFLGDLNYRLDLPRLEVSQLFTLSLLH